MVTLNAWSNTGFSAVDLPKSRETLETKYATYLDQAVDLCQIYNLSEIRLTGQESEACDVDYIELIRGEERAYYVVTAPPRMSSGNVIIFSVVPDPLMTAGGSSYIRMKGHIKRNTRNAIYRGRNNLLDPLMIPSFPVRRKYMTAFDDVGNGGSATDGEYYHVIASTVDLVVPSDFDPKRLYNVDFNSGSVSATWVPEPIETAAYGTLVEINLQLNEAGEPTTFRSRTSGYALFLYNGSSAKAIQGLWAIGSQSAILGSYKLPASLFTIESTGMSGMITKITMNSKIVNFGQEFQQPAALYADYAGPDSGIVKDNADLITFSDQYRIGIVSMISGSQQVSKGFSTTGTVICVADPRLNGKPYFILPDAVKEADTEDDAYNLAQLFSRGIPGGEWESVPLSYQGAMGWASSMAATVIRDDMATKRTQYANENAMYDAPGQLLQSGLSAMTGNINWENADYIQSKRATAGRRSSPYIDSITPIPEQSGFISSALGVVGNGIGSLARSLGVSDEMLTPFSSASRNNVIRQQESNRAISQYMVDNVYVAPTTTAIPATTWQGCVGNGIIIYVEYPDPEDVKKWARMVRFFGAVADEYPKLISNIGTPPATDIPYCYIQATGTITSHSTEAKVPASVLRDAENALAVGVRIWSVLPTEV